MNWFARLRGNCFESNDSGIRLPRLSGARQSIAQESIAQARAGVQRFFAFGHIQGDLAQNNSHFLRLKINAFKPGVGERHQGFIVDAPEPSAQCVMIINNIVDGLGQLLANALDVFRRACGKTRAQGRWIENASSKPV